MIGYSEIFPFSRVLKINYNQLEILIDDQYCLKSDCDCMHSALTIMKIKDDKELDGYLAPAILYNYNKNNWEIERHSRQCSSDEIRAIIEELKKSIPDISNILKSRHNKLRIMYRNYRVKKNLITAPVINAEKVGRNDPCPCGSGKKYKKCCGI